MNYENGSPVCRVMIQKLPASIAKLCYVLSTAHCSDLSNHRSTQKHKKNALPFSATRTLLDTGIKKVTVDNSTKISELKLYGGFFGGKRK